MTVRLYLDFDGVLNADKPVFNDTAKLDFKTRVGNGLSKTVVVRYSPTVVAELNRMVATHSVEVVALSTWNENLAILRVMEKLGATFNMRVLDAVLDRGATTDRAWTAWKPAALLADLKGDSVPFVWVDDEAIRFHGANVSTATVGVPSLFVEPREYWGLTPRLLKDMETFFLAHS
jgi:HAD domain in Swiss Army Knife RNA repair proteins